MGISSCVGSLRRDEATAYDPIISHAVQQFNTESRALAERDTYGKAFLQVMNLWVNDEAVKRYTMARRFAKIAADLMGVDGVRIYHDQALYKEPGRRAYALASGRVLLAARHGQHAHPVDAAGGYHFGDGDAELRLSLGPARISEQDSHLG